MRGAAMLLCKSVQKIQQKLCNVNASFSFTFQRETLRMRKKVNTHNGQVKFVMRPRV